MTSAVVPILLGDTWPGMVKSLAKAAGLDRQQRAMEWRERLEIADLAERDISQLSGGQRQRSSIARAILRDPSILILDEATSALDSLSESLIQDALADFVRDRTCIIIAHRFSTLSFCDRILVVNEGRIEAEGTHEVLMSGSPTYRDLFERQLNVGVR